MYVSDQQQCRKVKVKQQEWRSDRFLKKRLWRHMPLFFKLAAFDVFYLHVCRGFTHQLLSRCHFKVLSGSQDDWQVFDWQSGLHFLLTQKVDQNCRYKKKLTYKYNLRMTDSRSMCINFSECACIFYSFMRWDCITEGLSAANRSLSLHVAVSVSAGHCSHPPWVFGSPSYINPTNTKDTHTQNKPHTNTHTYIDE